MSAEALLAPLPAEARALLGRIGRRFGTAEVQAQAAHTLAAHLRFAAELRLHGFGAADRDRLVAARVAAASLAAPPKATDRSYVLALGEAKTTRGRARSVLLSAFRRLRASGDPGAAAMLAPLTAVLTETAEPGGDDRVYAVHLARLAAVLEQPPVRDAVADTGGPEAVARLAQAQATLRRFDEGEPPPPSRDADVLDGLIVELCRAAQFAAQSAAREVGNNAIAAAFRLVKLMTSPAPDRDGDE